MHKVECTGYQYLVRSYWLLWINCKNNCPIFFQDWTTQEVFSEKQVTSEKANHTKNGKKNYRNQMNQISMFFKTAFREDSDQFLQLWDLIKCFTSEVTRCRCHRHLVQIYLCWNKWFVSRYICHRTIFWIKMDRF